MPAENASLVVFCPSGQKGTDSDAAFLANLEKTIAEMVPFSAEGLPTSWSVKIPLEEPKKPNLVNFEHIQTSRAGLRRSGHSPGASFENLSITTAGLETANYLRTRARQLNLTDFEVGDESPAGPEGLLTLSQMSTLAEGRLSQVAAQAPGLLLLNSVRPHPFLGIAAATFNLGCGLFDRETKLKLHRHLKPKVDTPLCAGCGSCLAACIFDAISIQGGRATIDHKLCVGCGECLSACHLSGITPDDKTAVAQFQKQLAELAWAAASQSQASQYGGFLYVNFLTRPPKRVSGALSLSKLKPAPKGALISTDPVALDQATIDLLVDDAVHGLRQWSGSVHEPGILMERCQELGLGQCVYTLQVRH